ncbi:GNAT family N-acetyltransferase [Lysinibacillus piscis]|uniref:BioF2-like acetyltransferase domain-containing protein n=1 Tax=Lysinibacillus piscis TaxID=2518931 RepID=A0ABQ5NNF9_9BACI|nr:GNAT family N-acetyltransferase [Lysinibacillus sp. KH24]GLC89780.1 hypothetical protein LYSBPC_29070 [Lysinibacillus sp. KH24]
MLSYKLITTLAELASYQHTWSAILEREQNNNPFIEFEWISTWWATVGVQDNVEIYIVEQDGMAVAFFPLVHSVKWRTIHYFEFAGKGLATYMGVIAEKHWQEPAIAYLWQELAKRWKHLLVVWNGLLESTITSNLLEKHMIEHQLPYTIFRTVAPYIDFQATSLDDFLYKHRKKFKTIRRREKKLAALGQLDFQEVQAIQMDELVRLFARRWQRKIDKSGFTHQQIRLFWERLAQIKGQAWHVEMDCLQFEGHWIGFTLDICCRGRNVCLVMGHEPDFQMFGPGRLIEKENLLKAHRLQYRFYDFGSGYEPYKFEWYTHVDFSRMFVMSTKGQLERLVRLLMVTKAQLKGLLTNNHWFVTFKRDRLGELRYFLQTARLKDWLDWSKKYIFSIHIFDIYVAAESQKPCHEITIQDVMNDANRAVYIKGWTQGYAFYRIQDTSTVYGLHEQRLHDKKTGFSCELPTNMLYSEEAVLPSIGKACCTTVHWYEKKKQRQLKEQGFQKTARIAVWRFWKWQKVYQPKNVWQKFIQQQEKLRSMWQWIVFPFFI